MLKVTVDLITLFISILLVFNGRVSANDLPVSGVLLPEATGFECALIQFMQERGIPSASMVISKDGKWWVNRSYGFQDHRKEEPLDANPMFRIASLVKPMTAALVYRLEERGDLDLDAPIFINETGSGYLPLERFFPCGIPETLPAEIRTITVNDLVQHRGGWDRSISGDPVFMSQRISADLGLDLPPTQDEIVRWVISRPLDFSPGERRAYSNFGYLVLGLVIEEVTGEDYVDWARQEFSATCGLDPNDIALGRSFPVDRDPREPFYTHPGAGVSIYDSKTVVPYPDGAFHIEIMEAHGGLIVSPQAYMRFLEAYWISGQPRDEGQQSWIFFGSLPGTYTLGRQRQDGWNFVVFFNQRRDARHDNYSNIRNILDAVADQISSREK